MAHLCKVPNKDTRPFLHSFDDNDILPFDHEQRYGVSKPVSQLFIVKLAEIVNTNKVIISMVDPGLAKGTQFGRDTKGLVGIMAKGMFGIAGRPVEKGAATYVDAVLAHGKEFHGCFLMNCNISPYVRKQDRTAVLRFTNHWVHEKACLLVLHRWEGIDRCYFDGNDPGVQFCRD